VRYDDAMNEFFYGWRRKAGVFTLVMACALGCIWAADDGCHLAVQVVADDRCHCLRLSNRGIALLCGEKGSALGERTNDVNFVLPLHARPFETDRSHWFARVKRLEWDEEVLDGKAICVECSHFWATLPLLSLSVYLLVVPSRKRPATASQPHA
jgi:hypothetical protein